MRFEGRQLLSGARTVARPEPLGHDPLRAQLAGVGKHERAVRVLQVLFKRTPGRLLRRMLAGWLLPPKGPCRFKWTT